MQIGILGISHKTAHLKERELFAKVCNTLLQKAHAFHFEHPFVMLSTCNRTEIYFSSKVLAETHSYFLNLFKNEIRDTFAEKLYAYFNHNAFFHLVKVTAGLDSASIGETEIQGQVKRAYERATSETLLPSLLHYCFQKALKIGKEIRTDIPLNHRVPNLKQAMTHLGEELFTTPKNKRLLFVGASSINLELIHHFKKKGFKSLTLCNRTEGKALSLADKLSIDTLPWNQLEQWEQFDWIIFATSAQKFLINTLRKKRSKPHLLIDLSVPRNINPELAKIPDLHLYNIDQINQSLQIRQQKIHHLIHQAENLANMAVEKHAVLFKKKESKKKSLLACTA